MDMYRIDAECQNGHRQKLYVDVRFGEVYAATLAGLLDGSSPLYVYPPGQESKIAKCGICGTAIKCTLVGVEFVPQT